MNTKQHLYNHARRLRLRLIKATALYSAVILSTLVEFFLEVSIDIFRGPWLLVLLASGFRSRLASASGFRVQDSGFRR
jgi:hypothetical protein